MLKSFPLHVSRETATEEALLKIYENSKAGLKGDALAVASGFMPTDYRRLRQLDTLVEVAELQGLADGQKELVEVIRQQANKGKYQAAIALLQLIHGLSTKQQNSVELEQRISIVDAIEEAKARLPEIKALYSESVSS